MSVPYCSSSWSILLNPLKWCGTKALGHPLVFPRSIYFFSVAEVVLFEQTTKQAACYIFSMLLDFVGVYPFNYMGFDECNPR